MSNELRATVQVSGQSGLVVLREAATMEPASYPLKLIKGADFTLYVTWWNAPNQPVDLSAGYTAAFTVRYESGGTVLVTLTQAAGIALAATQPTLTITRTAAQTAAYTWGPRAQYALTVTGIASGVVTPLLTGPIDLVKGAI